jgi:hypothetical protein
LLSEKPNAEDENLKPPPSMSGKPKAVPQTSDAGNLKPKGEPELKELVAEKSKPKARVPEGGYPREALMDLHSTAILAADRKELKS